MRHIKSMHLKFGYLVLYTPVSINGKKKRVPSYNTVLDHVLDLLKCKVRAQSLQLNLRELTRVIRQMCAAIPHKYIHA